jgi:hypothetical protein
MLDLGRVVYLDTQKTGSTFLTQFLSTHSGLPVLFQRKHSPLVPEVWTREKVSVVMSIREPWSYYESLFKFGLDGKGQIFYQFRAEGKGDLYEPSEASFLKFLKELNRGHHMGLITRRLLAIMGEKEPSTLLRSVSEANSPAEPKPIHIVRMEHMGVDFSGLAHEWEGFGQLGEKVGGANVGLRRNASKGRGFRMSETLRHELQQTGGPLGELEAPVFDIYRRWGNTS